MRRVRVLAALAVLFAAAGCRTRPLDDAGDGGAFAWKSVVWSVYGPGVGVTRIVTVYAGGEITDDDGATVRRAQLGAADRAAFDALVQEPTFREFLAEAASCGYLPGIDITCALHYGVEPPLEKDVTGCVMLAGSNDPRILPMSRDIAALEASYFP